MGSISTVKLTLTEIGPGESVEIMPVRRHRAPERLRPRIELSINYA
jgi:hypothetical protein